MIIPQNNKLALNLTKTEKEQLKSRKWSVLSASLHIQESGVELLEGPQCNCQILPAYGE